MLDTVSRGIIALIKSALKSEAVKLPHDFDLSAAIPICKTHHIINMVYYGAVNCGVSQESSVMQELFMLSCAMLSRDERQMLEVNRVCAAFEENGVDFMPLKGILLRNMYPKCHMRFMGDADIFIKQNQYDKIKNILLGLGYKKNVESDHEIIWKNPALLLELHKRIIPSYNKDYYEYFGDGWRLAHLKEGTNHTFEMSPEDMFIYLFTHFSKHYRDGGIGVKHLCDLYVYKESHGDLDISYIEKELVKLKLYDFYKNVIKVIECWFEDAQFDDKSEFITDNIFNSGAFGTQDAHIISSAVKASKTKSGAKSIKLRRLFKGVFSPYRNMKLRYPILKKAPFLLPVMWVVRIFRVVIFRTDRIDAVREELSFITDDRISEYQNSLDYVGLDFNFKE